MRKKINKVIVLHVYGAVHHYRALRYLIDNDDSSKIEFYEFSITKEILKSVIKIDRKLLTKQIKNILNLVDLAFSRNKKIVLGIAPFDYRIYFLLLILRNHKIYYHTSQPFWHDGTPVPHKLFYSDRLLNYWNKFLTDTSETIFSSTMCTKKSLIAHKNVDPEKISVVNHSFDSAVYYPSEDRKFDGTINFLYVGRLTESKGVDKIIAFFQKHSSRIHLTIVGDGYLQLEVESLAKKCKHVTYKGYIKNSGNLSDIYREAHFFLLPSVKQKIWQELFGMVLIEAMACGVVPVASAHVGPKEIITDGYDGYLMEEYNFEKKVENIISQFDLPFYFKIRDNAIERASKFRVENISIQWKSILDE